MKFGIYFLIYMVFAGGFLMFIMSFSIRFIMALIIDIYGGGSIPYKDILVISLKVGAVSGVIGGVGIWFMNVIRNN